MTGPFLFLFCFKISYFSHPLYCLGDGLLVHGPLVRFHVFLFGTPSHVDLCKGLIDLAHIEEAAFSIVAADYERIDEIATEIGHDNCAVLGADELGFRLLLTAKGQGVERLVNKPLHIVFGQMEAVNAVKLSPTFEFLLLRDLFKCEQIALLISKKL